MQILIMSSLTTNKSPNKIKIRGKLTAAQSSERTVMSQHSEADGKHHGTNEDGDELRVGDLRPMTVAHREVKSRLKREDSKVLIPAKHID